MNRNQNLLFCLIFIGINCISCNQKNQYSVNGILPNAKTNATYIRLIAKYGLTSHGIPFEVDSVLSIYDDLQRTIAGGIGVAGTLTIEKDYIEFKPSWQSTLMSRDIDVIKIPTSDIDDVHIETLLYIGKKVVVSTKNGQIMFQPSYELSINPFASYAEEICANIKNVSTGVQDTKN